MAGETDAGVQELLARLDATTGPRERVDLLYDIADRLLGSSPRKADRYLNQALKEARAADSFLQIGQVLNLLAYLKVEEGRLEEANRLASESLSLAREHALARVEASARNVLGLVFSIKGDETKAIEQFQECRRISTEIGYDGVSTSLGNLANCYLALGEIEKALEFYESALELDEKRQDLAAITTSYNNIGHCHELMGDWEEALEFYYRGVATAERIDLKSAIAEALGHIALLFARRGRVSHALELYARAAALAEEVDHADLRAMICGQMAEVRLAQGDVLAAGGMIERSRVLAEAREDNEELTRCHRRMAEVLLASGDASGARSEIATAARVATRLGFRMELGVCRLVQARIDATLNSPTPADESFQVAIALLSGKGDARHSHSYYLAQSHFEYGRFLAAEHKAAAATEQLELAASLFRKLSILRSAEEASRFLLALKSATARAEETWFSKSTT